MHSVRVRRDTADRSTQGDDRRRAQLLEAAGRVFVRSPPGGLTMATVAAEARVSTRLMYYYFADVQSLYNELFSGRLGNHVDNVDVHLAAGPPETAEDRVATAVGVFLDLHATYRQWALLAVLDSLPPELQPQRGIVLDLLYDRWTGHEPFIGLDETAMQTVMSITLTTVCLLGRAMDAGTMTRQQAVDVSVATIFALARTARASIAADVS